MKIIQKKISNIDYSAQIDRSENVIPPWQKGPRMAQTSACQNYTQTDPREHSLFKSEK